MKGKLFAVIKDDRMQVLAVGGEHFNHRLCHHFSVFGGNVRD